MVVRILCLHGMASNATAFSQQTSAFRSLLATEHECVFLAAPNDCEPPPEVRALHGKPYTCWYDTPTVAKVAAAHVYVKDFLAKNGPFDGVIGFSQGAALTASILLHHQLESPSTKPPFSFAIFIGSPIPFSRSLDHGIDTRNAFGVFNDTPARPNCPTTIPQYLITDPAYLRGEAQLRHAARQTLQLPKSKSLEISIQEITLSDKESSPDSTPPPSTAISSAGSSVDEEEGEFDKAFYQMFHHTVDSVRIQIPTGHVYGRKDKWYMHSKDVVRLCEGGMAEVFEHGWGHEVPAKAADEIADLLETVIANSMS